MITKQHRLIDVERDAAANEYLRAFTSIDIVRRIFFPLRYFKFETLSKIPGGMFNDMHNFVNGEPDVFPKEHERRSPLWDAEMPYDIGGERPYIVSYYIDKEAPAVLVVPGGSYTGVAIHHEGQLVAEALNELGYHAVILRYRTSPNRYPSSHLDIYRAMQLIRKHAAENKVISDRVYAMGFSAGGHLVGSMPGVYEELKEQTGELKDVEALPNGLILGYPLINFDFKVFGVSAGIFLLGSGYDKALATRISAHNLVDESYVPTYQWSLKGDPLVKIDGNCRLMKEALDKHNIPNQLHIFPGEQHGTGLSIGTKAEVWFRESLDFVEKHNKKAAEIRK